MVKTAQSTKHAKKAKQPKAKTAKVPAPAAPPSPSPTIITAYKGFDKDFRCRGFQFEIGKEYEHCGAVELCESGFHACEYPLDVLKYYPPSTGRYAVVTQSGATAKASNDTKIVAAKLKIEAEISIVTVIECAVKWIFDHAKPENGSSATGDYGAASATGYSGAASATGDHGAASATGSKGRAKGANGCALFLVYRDDDWIIRHVWGGIVGQNGIKPDTWYTLDSNGVPREVPS